MEIIKTKLKFLKPNEKLRILRKTNLYFVSRYRQGYRCGALFPRIRVQRIKGPFYQIVCGHHRYEAMIAEFGEDYETEVELKEYPSQLEVLKDFVLENASHGNPLSEISRRMLCHELLKEGMSGPEIARLFNIPAQRIQVWEEVGSDYKVVVLGPKKQETEEFVKAGYEPAGGTVTRDEYKRHMDSDLGISVLVQANQITRWLRQNTISRTESNLEALRALYDALGEYLKGIKKTA